MKIVFFEVMPGEQEYFLQSPALPADAEKVFLTDRLCLDTVEKAAGAEVVSVFVKSEIPREVVDRLPNLKFITTRSAGFDHIDWKYAKEKGIRTINVPAYGAHTVAEFTFALMLGLARNIYQAYHQLREGTDFNISKLQGFNLHGRTLGVIGTGRIGKNVVGIAKGFGMNVLAFDVYPDKAFAASAGCQYLPLPELLAQSDMITLHVPYNQDTHHLLNAEMFGHVKRGAYLINTARGEVVQTEALIAALGSGAIAGAALDVMEGERQLRSEFELLAHDSTHAVDFRQLAANHLLIDLPNVIVTPHIAFSTSEAMQEIMQVTAESIGNFIADREQKYL